MKRGISTKTPSKNNLTNKDSLQVYCRLRPMVYQGDVSCIKVLSDTTVQLTLPELSVNFRNGIYKETKHSFRRVFTENDIQKTVFDEVALPLVEQLIRGRNGLLFTYGVTGSGKTYTMTGVPSDGGIMPRCLDVLFNSIAEYQSNRYIFKPDKMNGFEVQSEEDAARERQEEGTRSAGAFKLFKTLKKKDSEEDISPRNKDTTKANGVDEDNSYAVFVTYIEIYNNCVYDLLENINESDVCSKLQVRIIREDAARNMYVHCVTEVEVKDAEEAFEVFYKGQKRKRMAHTTLNTESSRSHSVFTIRLVQAPLDIKGETVLQDKRAVSISQLSLVDLAGSERTNRTKNCGQRLREAGNINNSLMTLRSCLEILRENQMTGNYKMIPYRESKLTHLFKNFFDGEGDIRMVVCVNPREEDYDETFQMMKFAEVSQDIQVPKQTPMKPEILNGFTPGRRRANQAYRKVLQNLEEKDKIQGHVPDDVGIIYSFGSGFPNLEITGPTDANTNKELISYLEERARRAELLQDDLNARTSRFRGSLLEYEQKRLLIQQENNVYKQMRQQDLEKMKMLNSTIVSLDSNVTTYKRKIDELEDQNKKMKREMDHKDIALNQFKAEKEKEVRRCNTKLNQRTEKLAREKELQAKENRMMELRLREKDQRLKAVKRILKDDNGATEYKPTKVMNMARSSDSSSSSECSSVSATPLSSARKLAVPKTYPISAKPTSVTASNVRQRRSRSVTDDRWLDHRSVDPVPLNTVFQPMMKRRKSLSKLTSPEQISKMSKYCLLMQNRDSYGEVETHLVKGDVVPTFGGGAQIIFNDGETLKQTSPVTSPIKKIISAFNTVGSTTQGSSLYPNILRK